MKNMKGFGLISLMSALVVMGIMFSYGMSTFVDKSIDCNDPDVRLGYRTRAKVANTIGALGIVNLQIKMFELSHNRLPENGELDLGLDPWGNEFVFLSFADISGNGPKRKFKSAVPVNKYFDVYSMGPDGKTATPMVSEPGGDDIIIAGSYIGIACFYYAT